MSEGAKIGIGVSGAFAGLVALVTVLYLFRLFRRKHMAKTCDPDETITSTYPETSDLPIKTEARHSPTNHLLI